MKYLLCANALVALALSHHEFHDRVAVWQQFPPLATCSISAAIRLNTNLRWCEGVVYRRLALQQRFIWTFITTGALPETISAWSLDPDVVKPDLRETVAADPKLRVLIVHGWNDLSCPLMGSVLTVDQIPVDGRPDAGRGA